MKEREKNLFKSAKMQLALFAFIFCLMIFLWNPHSESVLHSLLEMCREVILFSVGARMVNQLGDNYADTKKQEPK